MARLTDGISRVFQANWFLLDQVASSVSNLAICVIAANVAEPAVFGVFGVVYLGVAVELAVIRGGGGELMLFRFAEARSVDLKNPQDARSSGRDVESLTEQLLTVSLALGLCVALLTIIASFVVPTDLRSLVSSFAGALLVIPLQDSMRFVFFAHRQPGRALAIDIVWSAGLALGVFAVWWIGELTVASVVAIWALAAASSALVGLLMIRMLPARDGIRGWFAKDARRVVSLTLDPLVGAGAAYVLMQGLVLTAGSETTAALAGAGLMFQPVNTALAGLRWGVLRPLRLRVIERPSDVMPLAWRWVVGCVGATAAWYGLLLLGGEALLALALGDTATLAGPILVWFFVLSAVRCSTLIYSDVTRAVGPGHHLLRTRLVAAATLILAAWSGNVVGDVTGAAIGWSAGATFVGLLIWPAAASRAIRNRSRFR